MSQTIMDQEKNIINSLKNGDLSSMKKLMEIHQNYVYSLVFQMVKSRPVAEEITQDIFIKVYTKIDTYQEKSKFSTWLYTITYRTCLNYLGKKKIIFNLSEIESSTHAESAGLEYFSIIESDGPKEDSELKNILWKAINAIPQTQGVIITLYYLQQFSVKEIADMMNIPKNTIKINLFRGRKSLKEILQKNYSQEELL